MNPCNSVLLTDLYQLTMLQGYFEQDMDGTAVFEFFVRKLPPRRSFLVAAGLEQVLEFIQGLRFTREELDWLRGTGRFSDAFLDSLAGLRFTGHVDAMAEGTLCFPDEPLLRVTAPISQAQLLESRLVNLMHFQTLVASKAARCVLAAPGKLLVDFGMRRAHGAEAGLLAARAGYLAGMSGTATVLAGMRFGIPVFGTMAHSFVQAHRDESTAFESFARAQPDNVVLLLDSYDTERAARAVVQLAPRLRAAGIRIRGVRLDSGDLGGHARRVRAILDRGGCDDVTIFASSSLDEHALEALLAEGAPIDGFGIGTRLDTSADAPYLDCVYKLQEYGGRPRRKRSEGKSTWPGRKQVFRHLDAAGRFLRDVLTVQGETEAGEALVGPWVRDGERVRAPEALESIRARVADGLRRLPGPLRALAPAAPYPVEVAPALRALAAQVDAAS